MDLISRLQTVIAPQVFTPRAVYDGRKNLFAVRELPFPQGASSHEVLFLSFASSLEILTTTSQ
jgi:eukaryotic translation initiation factor 2C